MKITKNSLNAAEEIFERYETWLGSSFHGNQDKESCIQTIALIIQKYGQPTPEWLNEALNSGDGTYESLQAEIETERNMTFKYEKLYAEAQARIAELEEEIKSTEADLEREIGEQLRLDAALAEIADMNVATAGAKFTVADMRLIARKARAGE